MKKIYTYSTSILFLSIITFSLTSCERKWKETAPLSVTVKLINPAVSEFITFSSGEIYLGSIGVIGERNQGDDIAFNNALAAETFAELADEKITPSITYDIPQGTYTRLMMNMGIKPKVNIGSIILIGEFIQIEDNGEQEIHRIEFVYQPATEYALNAASSGEINIVADQKTEAVITLDATYLFSGVTNLMWQSADHVELDGIETILVSENMNSSIYNILIERLNASFSAHIEY